jgi:error-prone DNA polymerase
MMSSFVHLNVHSEYSALTGASSIESLCEAARARGFDAIALTDTNGLYGAVRFQEIAKQTGLKPIFGAELENNSQRALLLVKDSTGYGNLCRLLSVRREDSRFDLIESLIRFREGLIVATGNGEIALGLKRHAGDDLYVEISPGKEMNRALALSQTAGLPLLATNRVHFTSPEEFPICRVLAAIRENTKLSRISDLYFEAQHWLSPADVFVPRFPNLSEAIANTRRVADQCDFVLDCRKTIFPAYRSSVQQSSHSFLREKTYAGAVRRYGRITAQIAERLERELQIVEEKGFEDYFLIVEEITRNLPVTCGRGSGAASIIAYCLGITHVDPIRHKLSFERFLNRERRDPPDLDIDIPWDERESLLGRVFAKYGRNRVAMVGNHNRFAMAGALREIAKIYGIPPPEITPISQRLVKENEIACLAENPRSPAWVQSLCRSLSVPEPWPEILEIAQKIDGRFRNLSVHCGGLVIVPEEIRRHVPVEKAACGLPVLQWDKEAVELAGLVKIDLLGNRSLSVIRDVSQIVGKNIRTNVEYSAWDPIQDEAAKDAIRTGETIGCFNIESPAVRLLLKRLWLRMPQDRKEVCDIFEYLIMISSLVRPAAISYVPEFLARAHSGEIDAPDCSLGELLNETHGLMLYQEDVTRVAIALAGFSEEQADGLRRALNKRRKSKKLQDYYDEFCRGARFSGASAATIKKVWQMIMSFAGYSFCKAHSASYAQVSFKCAYLKAHYPAEFMAAVLSHGGGYYPALAYISEARRMGLKIDAPDVNESDWKYRASGKTLRAGFQQIRGIHKKFIDRLIAERNQSGSYKSFTDFCQRLRPSFAQCRLLIKSGSLDGIRGELTRPGMLWRAHAHQAASDPEGLPNPQDYSDEQKRANEIECFGFPLSCHPLELCICQAANIAAVPANELQFYIGKQVTLLGWLITEKLTQTRKGEPMEFVTFEDTSAIYETTFFPDVYRRLWRKIIPNRPFIIHGRVEEELGTVTVNVSGLEYLDETKRRISRESTRTEHAKTEKVSRRFSPIEADPG